LTLHTGRAAKFAVVDETGKVLDTAVIYPTPPQNKVEEAKEIMKRLIEKHGVDYNINRQRDCFEGV